jgi:glycosyltransferase involved in cell wall biosynthesis
MPAFTTIILTLDEAANLPRCLAALPAGLPVVVADSGSRDGTREVALGLGAKVIQRPFDRFGTQRNWAMDHPVVETDWVLFLDADEEATTAFLEEVAQTVESGESSNLAGAYCCWKMMLRGRWLRRADNFPKWQMRLVHRRRMRFTDIGHGQKEGEVNGELTCVREPYLHHAFSKGWSDWLARHNRYSSQEAVARQGAKGGVLAWKEAAMAPIGKRNQLLKPLVSTLAFWPVLRFLRSYVLGGGFLEGRAGLDYCLLMAIYEYFIQLKMRDDGQSI